MLNQAKISPTVAVTDVAKAKEFYGGVLGLTEMKDGPAGVTYDCGGTQLLIFPSPFAGTNKATYAGWSVDDVDAAVSELKAKGVPFQTFEMEGIAWDGEVAVIGDIKSAWFSDPDGNIFAISNM